MPNSNRSILDSMEFEERLLVMGDNQPELLKFIARQTFQISKLTAIHDKDIKKLQNRSTKTIGITGGLSGMIGIAIGSAIDFLLRR